MYCIVLSFSTGCCVRVCFVVAWVCYYSVMRVVLCVFVLCCWLVWFDLRCVDLMCGLVSFGVFGCVCVEWFVCVNVCVRLLMCLCVCV